MSLPAMGMNRQSLCSLFHACDVDNSGRIEKDEFFQICSELLVPPTEREHIFSKLDIDRDGKINLTEFISGFHWISEQVYREDMENKSWGVSSQAWEDFQTRLGDHARFIPRNEQAATLYQNISMTEPRMVPQYERVIMSFTREIKQHNAEMENLALAVKRAHDQAAMQLSEMEEEMDQRIHAAENNTQQQEAKRTETALSELKRHYESEVCELQHKLQKMQLIEDQYKNINMKDESSTLKRKINELTLENQRLKQELMQSQTNIAFLQSELASLKSDLTDHSINSERDEAMMRDFSDERENLERQIEILQTANRKLHDSNDGLRSSLENTLSKSNKRGSSASPANTISRRSKSICYSSPYRDRFYQAGVDGVDADGDLLGLCGGEGGRSSLGCRRPSLDTLALALCDPAMQVKRSSEVDSLPESSLDSGMSTLRGSNNEYDSEQEVKGHEEEQRVAGNTDSLAGGHSDNDVAEMRDEMVFGSDSDSVLDWKPLESVSRTSSGASTRKALSAITNEGKEKESADLGYMTSEKAYRVVLAGDAAVGKSSFLLRLCKNEFRGNTSATLGVDFQMKTLVVDGEPTLLQLWDTAGQERFRSIAKSYFRRADGVLLLYDVTCEKSFLNVREWVDMIEDVSQDDIPIMLVGNKCDLREQALQDSVICVPTSFGEKLAMTYNALFCETSAKDGSNVIEAVLHLAREMTKQVHGDENQESVTNLYRSPNKKMPTVTCCTG
ncbi:ras and EF-hand domain-containing protein homolog [Oncorhynchus tshawytscha]|uniref:EF-hand domain-containing protein n=1 Tax=Oncorhynchus tshawytscha TaxID=74940 RepID=A0A8C8J121_ONCTS|nr:ras and EF-hand domain-containing protein homolog [Oncorhynchus tshawytscha]